jgi:molybdate transport system ATP-binding protein
VLAPEVLALDEPSANLDVTVRRRFRQDLERIARAHAGSVLVVTHDPAEAFSLADRIAVMEGGRVIQVATPEALMLAPATPFVAEFAGAELLLDGRVLEVDAPLVRVALTRDTALWAAAATDAQFSAGVRVHVAYRPEDVTLAPLDAAGDTSAVNRLRLTVAALAPAGALVRIRLRGELELVALVTRRSAEHLALAAGVEVAVHLKATALRAYVAE